MFLTGEEEEEWIKDAVEEAEEPCAEVSAVAAAALAAAAAEAAKYQSLIDIEERRFDLLQVHPRFFKYSQTNQSHILSSSTPHQFALMFCPESPHPFIFSADFLFGFKRRR